jgi:superfamily II DNA or RNA helicase
MHSALRFLLGGVTAAVSREDVSSHILTPTVRVCPTTRSYCAHSGVDLRAEIVEDRVRDMFIVAEIAERHAAGRSILALGHTLEQLDRISGGLQQRGVENTVITGTTSKKRRAVAIEDARSGGLRCLLATAQLASEGLDIPALDLLAVVVPFGNPTRIEQSGGRVCRPWAGKKEPIILDFLDEGYAAEQMFAKRCAVYRKLGWNITGGTR